MAPVLYGLIVILLAAKLGGEVFERFKQPSVLGELIFGVLLGNLALANINFFDFLRTDDFIDIFARVGVIILLFEVGLESDLKEMKQVGIPSLLVAIAGVIAPLILGYMVSRWFLPAAGTNTHLFIGATLCATSVGITARVFKDLGKLGIPEARIVLGAAVIDDVLGLIILAIISGIINTGSIGLLSISWVTLKAILFLVLAIGIGTYSASTIGKYAAMMQVKGVKTIVALIFAFVLSYLADSVGLSTIVGAFAAGLILEEGHFENFRGDLEVRELIKPISYFLVPIFFVLIGIQVRLETFADVSVLGIAAGLTLAAIVGKQVCGLTVKKEYNRFLIGLAMIPRGEVGLIFASIGKVLGVLSEAVFSAIVIMVIVTTLVTPPVLKFSLKEK
ncbi:MAG: hypothetical protein A3G93_16830 [Nitrospinae bacterium RIFCSPLOWO2_12_FULL_45_22]|nr:MAG: hypothetical protein A3G93_16830 [Nitrospinae bacterium RIFCSPLOWO2_12_FULL_45_22]